MNLSDSVANYIRSLLEENNTAIIQRNQLAAMLGCVPSQISYVIASRFTPERGYRVESQRGGGGCIRITRVIVEKDPLIMHAIHAIGDHIDATSTKAILLSLAEQDAIDEGVANAVGAVFSTPFSAVAPEEIRDTLYATLLKNILITQL